MGNARYKVQINVDTTNESCFGAKHNYLTIIGFRPRKHNCKILRCRCDCGNEVDVTDFNWKSGRVKSCGCMAKKLLSDASSTLEHTPDLDRLRRIYNGMKNRCYNPNVARYVHYGGRGITICDEWLKDREAFISWSLSHGYRSDLSIDRIDVNGNYEPANCRWATYAVQRMNQRPRAKHPVKCKNMFTIDGVTKPGVVWCEQYGVSMQMVMYRIRKMGMSPFEALTAAKLPGRPCSA